MAIVGTRLARSYEKAFTDALGNTPMTTSPACHGMTPAAPPPRRVATLGQGVPGRPAGVELGFGGKAFRWQPTHSSAPARTSQRTCTQRSGPRNRGTPMFGGPSSSTPKAETTRSRCDAADRQGRTVLVGPSSIAQAQPRLPMTPWRRALMRLLCPQPGSPGPRGGARKLGSGRRFLVWVSGGCVRSRAADV